MNFETFYRERRNLDPFPWMSRLAAQLARGDLPRIVDLPTGSGKSDFVFVWAWARKINRTLPRRLWMVSDRRVIVDQTYRVAKLLAADATEASGVTEPGILVSRLRGGIVVESDKMLDPVRPQIITSTVDQLGSRLLFRGFGCSPGSWPIWAALAGNDSLIVLDEAHLSPVAEETFRACRNLGASISIISMTATPRNGETDTFRLDDSDRAHPILGKRLDAKRWVELREETPAEAAIELLAEGAQRLAVICNTVRNARAVFSAIGHDDKYLLTGRQRPLDREQILEGLLPRIESGAPPSAPLIVVATQCIEAGADFDFDAMVSEACPIDALRQRLGRLDRLGNRGASRCILVRPTRFDDLPPYGGASEAAWRWLETHAKSRNKRKVVELGAEGWTALGGLVPEEARSARPERVTLLKPHLRQLARTSPRPTVESDIDLYLHGPDRDPGAVSLVWRREKLFEDVDASAATEILRILPPSAPEACEIPLWEARAWLVGISPPPDAGDVEGAAGPKNRRNNDPLLGRVLRWDGWDAGATVIDVKNIRAGDVLVVAASRGGYDDFGWSPASGTPVDDLADDAHLRQTGRSVVRHDDPEYEASGFGVHHWSRGTVIETYPPGKKKSPSSLEVRLDDHQSEVARQSRADAEVLGLEGDALYLAGLYHDAGKANPQWQLCVNGGRLDRCLEPPLAKGKYARSSLTRLPPRWRHEAESLSYLPQDAPPLVRWLVATHHGYARPFWPLPDHGIGLAELMDELLAVYGTWGLPLHEAVLRCADRKVSRKYEEQQTDA